MLCAEHFKLMVASFMWHCGACVEGTKENTCYSSPGEAAVSAKDFFSLFYPFLSLCVFEKSFFVFKHLQEL